MSHEPPIPEAARSPYPLQPPPVADREPQAPVKAQTDDEPIPAAETLQSADEESWTDRARETVGRVRESADRVRKSVERVGTAKVGLAAAVGIGSAAVVAAVMWARRGSEESPKRSSKARQNAAAKAKPRAKALASKREVIEPTPGGKQPVRRKAGGTFGKAVNGGKSPAAKRPAKANMAAKSGEGDRDQPD